MCAFWVRKIRVWEPQQLVPRRVVSLTANVAVRGFAEGVQPWLAEVGGVLHLHVVVVIQCGALSWEEELDSVCGRHGCDPGEEGGKARDANFRGQHRDLLVTERECRGD